MGPFSSRNTKAGSPCCCHPIYMGIIGTGEDKLEQAPYLMQEGAVYPFLCGDRAGFCVTTKQTRSGI